MRRCLSAGITKGVRFEKSQQISKVNEIFLLLESVLQKSEEGTQKNCTAWGLRFFARREPPAWFFCLLLNEIWICFNYYKKQLNNRFTIHRMAILCLKNYTTPLINCVHFQNCFPSPQIKPLKKIGRPPSITFILLQYSTY